VISLLDLSHDLFLAPLSLSRKFDGALVAMDTVCAIDVASASSTELQRLGYAREPANARLAAWTMMFETARAEGCVARTP
jgi:hypothetical protein